MLPRYDTLQSLYSEIDLSLYEDLNDEDQQISYCPPSSMIFASEIKPIRLTHTSQVISGLTVKKSKTLSVPEELMKEKRDIWKRSVLQSRKESVCSLPGANLPMLKAKAENPDKSRLYIRVPGNGKVPPMSIPLYQARRSTHVYYSPSQRPASKPSPLDHGLS